MGNNNSSIQYDSVYSDKFKKNLSDENIFYEYLQLNKEYLVEAKSEKNNSITKDKHILDYLISLHDSNILVHEASVGHNRKRDKIHAHISFTVSERYYHIMCETMENLLSKGLLRDFLIERVYSEEFEDDGMYMDKFTVFPSIQFPRKQRNFEHLQEVTDFIITEMNNAETRNQNNAQDH
jgi:hypothetical protein